MPDKPESKHNKSRKRNDEIIAEAIKILSKQEPTKNSLGMIKFLNGDISGSKDFSSHYIIDECDKRVLEAYYIKKRRLKFRKSKDNNSKLTRDYSPFREKKTILTLEGVLVEIGLYNEKCNFNSSHGNLQQMASFIRALVNLKITKEDVGYTEVNEYFTKNHQVPELCQIHRRNLKYEARFGNIISRIRQRQSN